VASFDGLKRRGVGLYSHGQSRCFAPFQTLLRASRNDRCWPKADCLLFGVDDRVHGRPVFARAMSALAKQTTRRMSARALSGYCDSHLNAEFFNGIDLKRTLCRCLRAMIDKRNLHVSSVCASLLLLLTNSRD
jgi:hypothetical protein